MAAETGAKPLQLVQLNMAERQVEVNEEAVAILVKKLKKVSAQTQKVAIVSVMGAFRTGKSFLLDLFLRRLRYEQKVAGDQPAKPVDRSEIPPRGENTEYPTPAWLLEGGDTIDGATDEHGGFRFRGGMDHCTEGIWVWSEPFLREVNGETIALLLMDTQGAWGGEMTKEQSATVFGLTAVISSKQIYNINMQIQQDKVENLAYFMRFAQDALRQAQTNNQDNAKPFQSLDFLVRDWANFEDEWTMEKCKEQMSEHLSRHVDPTRVVENSTAEALQSMFDRIGCFCMPHPGLKIQKATWSGAVKDINQDFIRFIDEYVQDVFSTGLTVKTLLGAELSTTTFPYVLRDFVKSFQDATPVAMSFTEAMSNATTLMAKERLLKTYTQKMNAETNQHPRGIEPNVFAELHRSTSAELEQQFKSTTILGSDEVRREAWEEILEQIQVLYTKYSADNSRRLEQVLIAFANLAILVSSLFILDRASDWTCDWWMQTCRDLSSLMFFAYFAIFAYISFFVWNVYNERGALATSAAGAEMWKEMVRLCGCYGKLLSNLKFSDARDIVQKSYKAVRTKLQNATGGPETKKNK